MKRFIRYLYEYEQEKRIRNVGFIKVEAGNEETIVHLQAKGFHNRQQQLGLYLFYRENEQVVRILQEEIKLSTPTLSHHLIFRAMDEKLKDIYEEIAGILIETEDGKRVAATWNDGSIDVSRLVEYTEGTEEEDPGSGALEEEEMVCSVPEEERICPAEEYEGEDESREEVPVWGKYRLTKISRQDISRLPRCEWKLANNKFLVHGYESFHHLLLIDNGKDLKLGVPGIYHIKEASCAEVFGFNEFFTAEELGIRPDTEEEMFGYWCRSVRNYQRSLR